jgi:hypothetical protein
VQDLGGQRRRPTMSPMRRTTTPGSKAGGGASFSSSNHLVAWIIYFKNKYLCDLRDPAFARIWRILAIFPAIANESHFVG